MGARGSGGRREAGRSGDKVRFKRGKKALEGWRLKHDAETVQCRRGLVPKGSLRNGVGLAQGSLGSIQENIEKAERKAVATTSTSRRLATHVSREVVDLEKASASFRKAAEGNIL